MVGVIIGLVFLEDRRTFQKKTGITETAVKTYILAAGPALDVAAVA